MCWLGLDAPKVHISESSSWELSGSLWYSGSSLCYVCAFGAALHYSSHSGMLSLAFSISQYQRFPCRHLRLNQAQAWQITRDRDARVRIIQRGLVISQLNRHYYYVDLSQYPHHETISIDAPSLHFLTMSRSTRKIPRFKIMNNKEMQWYGSTNDIKVFIIQTIQGKSISKIIQNKI